MNVDNEKKVERANKDWYIRNEDVERKIYIYVYKVYKDKLKCW